MDLEAQVRDAILTELTRQSEEGGALKLTPGDDGSVAVDGRLDLEALAMAIVGAVAGGP